MNSTPLLLNNLFHVPVKIIQNTYKDIHLCPPKHHEDAAGVGAAWEDDVEGGGGDGHIRKVLSRGNKGGAVVWGGDVGLVGGNGEEAIRYSCGVPETGDKVKVKESEGLFVEEGGRKKILQGAWTQPL